MSNKNYLILHDGNLSKGHFLKLVGIFWQWMDVTQLIEFLTYGNISGSGSVHFVFTHELFICCVIHTVQHFAKP